MHDIQNQQLRNLILTIVILFFVVAFLVIIGVHGVVWTATWLGLATACCVLAGGAFAALVCSS